jgi:hypothetical protein
VSDKSRQSLAAINDLVEKGADGTMALRDELETKLNPRHDIVFYLISMGSTVDLKLQISHHRNCADIYRFLLHQKLRNLDEINKPGDKIILHSAMGNSTQQIEHGRFVPVSPEAIGVLCEHGADVNCGGKDEDAPLHTALHLARDGWGISEKTDFVRVLLEWGPDLWSWAITSGRLWISPERERKMTYCSACGSSFRNIGSYLRHTSVAKSNQSTITTRDGHALVVLHLLLRHRTQIGKNHD